MNKLRIFLSNFVFEFFVKSLIFLIYIFLLFIGTMLFDKLNLSTILEYIIALGILVFTFIMILYSSNLLKNQYKKNNSKF